MRGLNWIRSVLLVPGLLAWTALMALISLTVSLGDHKGLRQHGCARLWARGILRVSGVRVRIGGEALGTGPYVLASNHQSFFDIFALLAALPLSFRFIAKDSLFRAPFLGWHLKRAGHISLDRSNPRSAYRSLEEAARRIASGTSVLIFPEGSRSSDGKILEFKRGSMRLAEAAGVPVVPVAIFGTAGVLPRGSVWIHPGGVDIAVGKPLPASGDLTDRGMLAKRVRDEIAHQYKRLESGEADWTQECL